MIVVTGANGFIGSALCAALRARYPQEEIIGVDPVPRSTHDLLARVANLRLIGRDEIWEMLDASASEVRWVIHMGACSSTTETNWDFLQENNVAYTERLFAWCAQSGVPFIYASSAATYGDGSKGFDDTTDPADLMPLNLYGKSKLEVDRWALAQTGTPPQWYALKFFNVFGPNEYFKGPMTSLAYKAYYQILETGRLKLFKSYLAKYGDGEQVRDFIYIKDITRWVIEIIEQKPESGVYNMGFGTARSWLDVAHALFDAMGKERAVDFVEMPENIRAHYQYFTEANMTRSFARGLSVPQWPLEAAIKDYVTNHLAQENKPY